MKANGKTYLQEQLISKRLSQNPALIINVKTQSAEQMFCAVCYDTVTLRHGAWFHDSGGIELGTIAREVTLTPLSKSKAVMPAPKNIASGFTVPKINGRTTQIRII